ncbi:MAG TPA: allophanate hydrolase [Acetobacteraceae bacterium]|nr:allophanate hydrolase [Acetobacteraceae bacterium]
MMETASMIPAMLQIGPLLTAYRAGSLSPVAVAETVLERVARYDDPAVWISCVPEAAVRARAAALAADPTLAARLPLYGIPFAVKDNMDVAGMETTAACPAFAYRPERTATVIQRLLDAGAILIGKTNLDQFATGLVGMRSPYGAPRSVFDRRYVSGGSSSGSAVAVAAGLVAFALGTDTAGSGRVPAAFNNIVGLKPTRGLLSTTGVVPACRSLDCVSVFAASAGDARRVADVAEAFDPEDPYARRAGSARLPGEGLRFGVLAPADRDFAGDPAGPALYEAAIARLVALGGTPVEIDYAPLREAAVLLYGGPYVAERLAAISDFFAAHAEAMDPTVRGIIGGARAHSAVDAFQAQYRLRGLARAAEREWGRYDVMLLPTAPRIVSVEEVSAEPVKANSLLGLYTNFVNLLDMSAIAIPAGFRPDGLPVGVTLIAPAFADRELAGLADRLHRALGEGAGLARERLAEPELSAPVEDEVLLAVVGAHLTGLPLHHQLVALGARLRQRTRTAPDYALYALPGTVPPKPGMVRRPGLAGPGQEVEVFALDAAGFGRFVAAIPAPLGIGKVTLADGRVVSGFLCEEQALDGARDITAFGGWRAYMRSLET